MPFEPLTPPVFEPLPPPKNDNKVGDILGTVKRGVQKAGGAVERSISASARDPVAALGNTLGVLGRGAEGFAMGPFVYGAKNDPLSSLGAGVRGAAESMINPNDPRFAKEFEETAFRGMRPKGNSLPAKAGRAAEDFTLHTMTDPVTHGGRQMAEPLLSGGKKTLGAVKPLAEYGKNVRAAFDNPEMRHAGDVISKGISTITPAVRGLVNAGKDVMFLNPFPHGLGNMSVLNYLKNGLGTTAKGLKYGITGAPKGTASELERIGAGAWTPEMMGETSKWGPVGWAERLPGPTAAKVAIGGGSGALAGANMDPNASPQERLKKALEFGLVGGTIGGAGALLKASNKVMSRLETGHRAAMLEKLRAGFPLSKADEAEAKRVIAEYETARSAKMKGNLEKLRRAPEHGEPVIPEAINASPGVPTFKPGKGSRYRAGAEPEITQTGMFPPPHMPEEIPLIPQVEPKPRPAQMGLGDKQKPHLTPAETKAFIERSRPPVGPAIDIKPYSKRRPPPLKSPIGEQAPARGSKQMAEGLLEKQGVAEGEAAASINKTFGGSGKSTASKVTTALGGPFAHWNLQVVPGSVGSALAKNPARVEAFTRGQETVNKDVLGDQQYKLQTGGPVGSFAEMLFNAPKYATKVLGPLGEIDPNQLSKPGSLNPLEQLKGKAYNATPGLSTIGPMFGDTMFPSKAPAGPSTTINTLLGWHFANKTPRQEAILDIMKTTGLDSFKANQLYDRYKR